MGFIGSIRAAWSAPSVSDDGHWTTLGGGNAYASTAGVTITEDAALSNPVVFDCVYILADAVGQSPVVLYDREANGDRQRAGTALAYRLREQPNDDQTAIEFKREMQRAACFYEWAFAEIEWRGTEPLVTPRHPARVRAARIGGRSAYEYLEDDGTTWRRILANDMLRVPGRPVLRYAAETMGQAIALERYSARLFGRSPRPAAVIASEKGVVYDDEAKKRIKAEMRANHAADKSGDWMWLPEGLSVQPWGMTNEQAQYLELRTALVGDLTRWWRIPPYMIGLLESGTVSYASVNTQSVDFVVYTLMPWLVGWEQAIQRDLVIDKRGQFAEFLTASFLRGTTKERYEVYSIALSTTDPVTGQPIMSVDEIRRLENLNTHDRGYRPDLLRPPTHTEPDSPAGRLLAALTRDAAGRVVRRETGALAKLAERAGPDAHAWEAGVREFYRGHRDFVAEALHLSPAAAAEYADQQARLVLTEGPSVAARWNGTETDRLVDLALTERTAA